MAARMMAILCVLGGCASLYAEGNLDEAAIVVVVLGALRYLDIPLPEFIESWITPSRQLPATIEQDGD